MLTGKPFSKQHKKWLRNTTRNINSTGKSPASQVTGVGPHPTPLSTDFPPLPFRLGGIGRGEAECLDVKRKHAIVLVDLQRGVAMDIQKALKGKWILVVDDEEDILHTVYELLEMCKIDTASTYEEAKALLEKNQYHAAILDIMGVRGYDLLDIATKRNIPALMLTAHALTKEDLKKSARKGRSVLRP